MTLPTYEEIYLGLAKIIRAVDPNMVMLLKGMPQPSLKDAYDFIAFDLLGAFEKSTRNQDGDRMYVVQLSCNSVHAEFRPDKKITAPYALADKYMPVMHRANHLINSSCFRMHDAKIAYLDLRASGDYSKQVYQNSPSLKVHTCVLSSTGRIN